MMKKKEEEQYIIKKIFIYLYTDSPVADIVTKVRKATISASFETMKI